MNGLLSCVVAALASRRLAEEFMLHKGGSIGYWQGEIPKVLDDIKALRPSLFCGVPRVFDRIYAGINEQVRSSNARAGCTAEIARIPAVPMAGGSNALCMRCK